MKKLLTVVIPVYNMERLFPGCMDSLLACPSAGCTELLVVDDGSTDGSGRLADGYAERYPGIVRVIHKENGGHGSAINAGIASAAGQYFRIVDSDDAVEPAAYEAYLQELKKLAGMGCDLVATPFVCVWYGNSGKNPVKIQQRQIEGAEQLPKGRVLPFQEAVKKASGGLHIRMHEWTIRTAILKGHDIRLSEHSFYVDMQYILFPVPWIQTICILNETVYHYRLGSELQSVSVKSMQKNRGQHLNVLCSLVHFYKEREAAKDGQAVLDYLAYGIAKMEVNQIQTVLSLPIGKAAKAELVECEQKLKQNCPAAYAANRKRSIQLLRKTNYAVYPVAATVWRIVKR